ncbi:MAG: hypothetical protein IT581_08685 [Verrucomicrobiales bacterium]|nr:hypothetical protein [Verrucomicrobiales bacterium]
MPPTEITRRDHATRFRVASDQSHEFRLRVFHLRVLELEDAHFHLDSAVLLADYDTDDPQPDSEVRERVTALVAIAEGLKYARSHPTERTLVAGHTDTSGSTSYNLPLSNQRARSAMSVIMGDRQEWVSVVQQRNRVEDYQLILKWVARDWGWDCDPGPVDNQLGQGTRDATSRFQQRYNQEFNKNIGTHGNVDATTWGAFFDVYQTEIRELLDTDDAGLAQIRANLQFADAAHRAVGCGEHFPIEARGVDGFRSRTNRRVEWMFFDPAELPLFECHPGGDRCLPDKCEVNNPRMFVPAVIPVAPVLPRRLRVRVNLRFAYRDPVAGQPDHPFPEQCPVTLVFGDGSANQVERMQADGRLAIWVDKRKRTMAVQFDFSSGIHFFGSATPATTRAERELLVPEAQLAQAITDHYNVFELPQLFTLGTADWPDKPATVVNDAFDLNAGNVGSSGTPQPLTLDPHWQHLQFLYFDRRLKQKLSILPIVIEGFFKVTGTGAATDTDQRIRSRWATDPQACQCVPWILRKRADGTALTNPDQNCALRFRTQRNTFIDSTGGTVGARRLVTGTAGTTGGGAADPSVASGVGDNRNFGQPNAERLSFYDLPEMWRSRGYFARLSAAAADQGVYENLANRATTDAQPLTFALDDMVLTDAALSPLAVTNTVRVAIFGNTFDQDPARNLHNLGVFDADPVRPYFSRPVDRLSSGVNYLATYADWTRLVVMDGNLFDVFDRRMPDTATGVVGARAAVRWFDATAPLTAATVTVPGPGNTQVAAPSNHPQPGRVLTPNAAGNWPVPHTHQDFIEWQPFYSQFVEECRSADRVTPPSVYQEWATAHTNRFFPNNRVGRFDLALLRCCDVDGTTEVSIALQYFRFNFNFITNAASLPTGAPGVTTNTTTAQQDQFILNTTRQIMARWNEANGNLNAGRGRVVPTGANPAFRTDVVWFLQAVPLTQAHFRLDVVGAGPTARAFMASEQGTGMLTDTSGAVAADGTFVAAHECGHGGSHFDEYNEQWSTASYEQLGFTSWIAGDPYRDDSDAIMNGNREVRARYHWHVADWLHRLPAFSGVNFQVQETGAPEPYRLEHYPHARSGRTLINWPLASVLRGAVNGAGSLADLFLARMGSDRYTRVNLPATHQPSGGATFDGILVVKVKIEVVFTGVTQFNDIQQALIAMAAIVQSNQNNRQAARFSITAGGMGAVAFNRCLLHFSPRWLVPTYVASSARYNGLLGLPNATATTPAQVTANRNAYNTIVTGVENFHPPHWGLELSNTAGYVDGAKPAGSPPTSGPLAASTNKFGLRFVIPAVGAPNYAEMATRFHTVFLQMLGLTPANFQQAAANRRFFEAIVPAGDHASIQML